MTPRVFLHVGVPKTGTTFIQDVLWRSRAKLARAGVCYPLARRAEHFAATMDVREASWAGRRQPGWDGTWDRLARTVRESGAHTGVISSELLAAADPDAVDRAVGSFPDHEVHVVLTVRDLARQLVSGWQEQLKHKVTLSLDEFVAGCLAETAPGTADVAPRARRLGERFWRLHDLPEVAGRWAAPVGASRLHLVTVPGPGEPRSLLWDRFAAVVGLDSAVGRVDTARHNTALGAAEAELVRRLNASSLGRVAQPHYDQVVRVLLAEGVLAGGHTRDLLLPARHAEPVVAWCRTTVQRLAAAGYPVSGDLNDLVPDLDRLRAAGPAPVGDPQLAQAAIRAAAGMIAALGPLQRRLKARGERPADPPAAPPRRTAAARRLDRQRSSLAPGPVFVHVGAPKTGTTFLQDVMWHHRDRLADAGVLFARRRYDDHFRASLELREAQGKTTANGVWDRVVADTRGWPGTSVISHEFFAAAGPGHVQRALESLGPERVHVVYTARDLWRLLAAEWQENTKHGREQTFDEFLTDVLEQGLDGMVGRWFWTVHDPVDVLARWGRDLPPERVHVVTVPPSGGDPLQLWRRFAGVVGIDPTSVDPSVARPNASLGAAEVTFLRRVNAELGTEKHRMQRDGEYGRFVKTLLAQEILAGRPGKLGYAPPPELFERVHARSEQLVAGLRRAGYAVAGDLDELLPVGPGAPTRPADAVTDRELTAVGEDAVAGLVQHAVRMREAYGVGVHEPQPGRDGAAAGDGGGPSRPVRRARRLLRRARSGLGAGTRRGPA